MINFDEMIDNYLRKEQRPKEIGKYYPSEVGLCMRKTWYSYKYPVSLKPEMIKIFEMGNMLHDFVVKVLASEKNTRNIMLISTEAPFRKEIDDFIVSGRIDDIILIKANGKNVIVEVKSTGNIDMIEEPVYYNKMQLQFYMYVLGIHNGILLYVDKRNLKSRVFTLDYDEGEAMKIVNRFRALHKLLKYDAVPDPELRADQEKIWMCRNCDYRERCYSDTPSSARWL
jgi:CRISPR/Cas system-associated exonuclease Cas4 (RecB family)